MNFQHADCLFHIPGSIAPVFTLLFSYREFVFPEPVLFGVHDVPTEEKAVCRDLVPEPLAAEGVFGHMIGQRLRQSSRLGKLEVYHCGDLDGASVVFYSDATLSASQARATLARISSALAVQTNIFGLSL